MAQKSKYLIWLETLQREYTDRTNITLFGQQAASIKLLADMFEVRCRFERILERMQKEAVLLEDEDVDYMHWVSTEAWEGGKALLATEDLRNTIGIDDESIMPQKYAESLMYAFVKDEKEVIKFDTERFRNAISTLFVFEQIVDQQQMEFAISNELERLKSALLNISNARNLLLSDDEYAAYYDKRLTEYKTNFLKVAQLQGRHKTWKDGLDNGESVDLLQERRVELLLDLFGSGFLDSKKKECHKWTLGDVLKFKEYDFEEWNDKMDDAVKYFEALTKMCPYNDDMIDFGQSARLGKYIFTKHIETAYLNSFFENMELIKMVQEDMRLLLDHNARRPVEGSNPAEHFVERVKHIMLKAEDDNGTEKRITARGNGGTYTYNVDGKGFVKVMDELLACHDREIKDYLGSATAKQAIAIKYVAPFIGMVIDTHLYTPSQMPKTDMKEVFETVYGKNTSAVSKMSDKHPSEEAKKLYETTQKIMKKHKNA